MQLPIRVSALLRRLYATFLARAGVHPLLPILVVGTSVMLLALDPFGVQAASHERSEQATLRIMAPFYKASGQVAVILIDDEYVTNRHAGWPLSYADQGRLMRAVLAYKPAVLLIDLVYPHRHANAAQAGPQDQAKQLLDPIIQAGEEPGGTPLVFTAMALTPEALASEKRATFKFCSDEFTPGRDDLLDPAAIQPDLKTLFDAHRPNEADSRMQRAYIRWSGCGDHYPLLLGGNPKTVTPAFAAYRAYCNSHSTESPCNRSHRLLTPPTTCIP